MTTGAGLRLRAALLNELRHGVAAQLEMNWLAEDLARIDNRVFLPSQPKAVGTGPTAFLPAALDNLQCPPDLAAAIRDVAPGLNWVRILDGADVDPVLSRGLVASQIVDSQRSNTRLGLFLISPGVHYPLHEHGALEVYYVASGNVSVQHGRNGTPFAVGPGEFSITPSNRLHALQTGDQPCLILYVWTGDTAAPSLWWDADEAGIWHRQRWNRRHDGVWEIVGRELVTDEALRITGES